mgnify:FL=1
MLVKMKEILVVEGKNDTNVLKSYLDCDTIETHGTHLGKEILRQIQLAQRTRGVIIFTDPDFPGEKIRSCINTAVPGCKNAFIDKAKARTSKKVGVEHASREDILEALSHLMTYDEELHDTLSYEEYLDLGLNGKADSAEKRELVAHALHLGRPNAKTLYKRLNMLQLNRKDVAVLLEQSHE